MTHLIAIDQGTTSTRAIVFDTALAPVASAQQEIKQIYPAPGLVEHDPEEIWTTVLSTVRAALAKAKLTARDIAAIGITNQRETTIVWDRTTGKPYKRDRLAGSPHRRHLCRLAALGPRGSDLGQDRTSTRSVFLRDQDCLVARSRSQCARGGRNRQACVRHHRQLSFVAAHWQGRTRN